MSTKDLQRRVCIIPLTRRGTHVNRIERIGFAVSRVCDQPNEYVARAEYVVLRRVVRPLALRFYLDGKPHGDTPVLYLGPATDARAILPRGRRFELEVPFRFREIDPEQD